METIRAGQVTARARRALAVAWVGLRELAVAGDPPRPAPTGRLRWFRRRGTLLLALLALLVTAAMAGAVQRNLPLGPGLALPVAALICLPIALLARWPRLGWRLAFLTAASAGLIARVDAAWPWYPVEIFIYLAAFVAAGLRVRRAVLAWMWALTVLALWVYVDTSNNDGNALGGTIGMTVLAVAVDAIGSRRRAQRELTAAAERSELEQARRAVLEERTRIARELHDVVAHHVSLIAVQAESAPYRLPELPPEARDEFAGISTAARESLHEMRRLLGVLRSEQPAERAPQPGLGDLDDLLATARHAGMTVNLTLTDQAGSDGAAGRLVGVPATVGTSAYRIVQESLTNAGRHAPGAPVTVRLDKGRDALRLEVVNGPGEPTAPDRADQIGQEGHGLVGMRERVTMLGGTLAAGAAPGGGFRVVAVLPLTGGPVTGGPGTGGLETGPAGVPGGVQGGVPGGVPGVGGDGEGDG
jgi:signal transduction histidine kinase